METLFAHTYLLITGKLAAGGLLALAVPPFTRLERGFYSSSGAVYLAAAWLMFGGDLYLYLSQTGRGPVEALPLALWGLFSLLFTAYYLTLYVEMPVLRAKLFPAALIAGFAALASSAVGLAPQGAAWPALLGYVTVLWAGAAITGAAVTGMLLGHWYLIDTGLDLAPFSSMLAYCRRCLVVEFSVVAVVLVALALTALGTDPVWREPLGLAFSSRYALLVAGRLLSWAMAAVLLFMAARTLAIPQTMAATGLFYIEALVGSVGQIVAHWLLFRTGLPL